MARGVKLAQDMGIYYDFPNEILIDQFFTNFEGQVVDGAPTTEELELFKSRDAFTVPMQTSLLRSKIQQGALEGYRLATVAFEEDIFYKIDWESDLHAHLLGETGTGEEHSEGFFLIPGSQAIQESPHSMPESLDNAIRYFFTGD